MTTDDVRLAAADLLDEARDVLTERGWIQGCYETTAGVCAKGALGVALGDRRLVALYVADRALKAEVGGVVSVWNDRVAESAEDVQLAMKKAAHNLREAAS